MIVGCVSFKLMRAGDILSLCGRKASWDIIIGNFQRTVSMLILALSFEFERGRTILSFACSWSSFVRIYLMRFILNLIASLQILRLIGSLWRWLLYLGSFSRAEWWDLMRGVKESVAGLCFERIGRFGTSVSLVWMNSVLLQEHI